MTLHVRHRIRIFRIRSLRHLVHNLEDALRACKGREEGRHLLREHVDRHRELSRVLSEHRQTADRDLAEDHQDTADTDRHSVRDLRGVAHDRAGHAAPELRLELLVTHIVVERGKFFHTALFVVEHLDNLLAGDRLLDVTVHGTEGALLRRIVLAAQFADGETAEQKDRDERNRHERQDPACRHHEDERTDQRDSSGDDLGERVVDHDIDVVDIVRKAGHDLAGLARVKEPHGKLLQFCEQIVADPLDHTLRDGKHQSCLHIGRDDTDAVDGAEQNKRHQYIFHGLPAREEFSGEVVDHLVRDLLEHGRIQLLVGGDDTCELVDDRGKQISADQTCHGCQKHAGEHERETKPEAAHVREKSCDRLLGALRLAAHHAASSRAALRALLERIFLSYAVVLLLQLFQ